MIIKIFFANELVVIYNSTKILTNYIQVLQGQVNSAVIPVFNYFFFKASGIDVFVNANLNFDLPTEAG